MNMFHQTLKLMGFQIKPMSGMANFSICVSSTSKIPSFLDLSQTNPHPINQLKMTKLLPLNDGLEDNPKQKHQQTTQIKYH